MYYALGKSVLPVIEYSHISLIKLYVKCDWIIFFMHTIMRLCKFVWIYLNQTEYGVYHNSAILPNTSAPNRSHRSNTLDWENLHSVYTSAGDRILYITYMYTHTCTFAEVHYK